MTVISKWAGFQDVLAAFGIWYALRFGLLTACHLLYVTDYWPLWQKVISPLFHTGIGNRFILSGLFEHGWHWVLRRLGRPYATAKLRRLYQTSLVTLLNFSVAQRRCRAAFRYTSFDHIDCNCSRRRCEVGNIAEGFY